MLANIISITFIISFITPLILFIYERDIWWIWLLGGLLGLTFIVERVKKLFGSLPPFGRPSEANGCNVWCMGGAVGGVPGFPSGHMAASTMFVTALWLHLRNEWVLWIGIPWLILMAWSRWAKHCHNWQQILAGTFTGAVFGGLLYMIAPRQGTFRFDET